MVCPGVDSNLSPSKCVRVGPTYVPWHPSHRPHPLAWHLHAAVLHLQPRLLLRSYALPPHPLGRVRLHACSVVDREWVHVLLAPTLYPQASDKCVCPLFAFKQYQKLPPLHSMHPVIMHASSCGCLTPLSHLAVTRPPLLQQRVARPRLPRAAGNAGRRVRAVLLVLAPCPGVLHRHRGGCCGGRGVPPQVSNGKRWAKGRSTAAGRQGFKAGM